MHLHFLDYLLNSIHFNGIYNRYSVAVVSKIKMATPVIYDLMPYGSTAIANRGVVNDWFYLTSGKETVFGPVHNPNSKVRRKQQINIRKVPKMRNVSRDFIFRLVLFPEM